MVSVTIIPADQWLILLALLFCFLAGVLYAVDSAYQVLRYY